MAMVILGACICFVWYPCYKLSMYMIDRLGVNRYWSCLLGVLLAMGGSLVLLCVIASWGQFGR